MKNKKKMLLIIAIIIAVLAIVAVIVMITNKNKTYRLITIDSMEGTVELKREDKPMEIFNGIHLKSGDEVSTDDKAYALLLADNDKHILAEENTGFYISATGNEKKGGITIHLKYGSALITIDNKLNEESSFDVQTPNATLSVRGTIFRATYDRESMCTTVEIMEGTVEITSENQAVMGNAGENYYVNEQGAIQAGTPGQGPEENTESNQGSESGQEVGTDIAPLADNGRVSPLTITQSEFESQYMEEKIELTDENSHEYFEIIQKDGIYHFVLKPGYTPYQDGVKVVPDDGDETWVSTGGSRYFYYMEGEGSPDGWMKNWTATGTIAKYSIPDDMWCKAGDKYIILISMDDGNVYAIER